MKATFATLGYAIAAILIVAGAGEVGHDVYRSLQYDGGMAFDATDNAAVPRSAPIRMGKVEIDRGGPVLLVLGGLLAASAHQVFPEAMNTPTFPRHALLLGFLMATSAPAADPPAAIREFDLPTMEKLGEAIHLHDTAAAIASDWALKILSEPLRETLRGWIVEDTPQGLRAIMVSLQGDVPCNACEITVKSGKVIPDGARIHAKPIALTDNQRELYAARHLAISALASLELCSPNYNSVVLPDPDGTGFLAYALAATKKPDEILVGGHYRFTIDANATVIERTDRLFRSCLTIPMPKKETGKEPVEMVASHVVSDTPLETHVFLSRMHGFPFLIITPGSDTVWRIEGGGIAKYGKLSEMQKAQPSR